MLTHTTHPWRVLAGIVTTLTLASTLSAGSLSITAENGNVTVLRTSDQEVISSIENIEDGTQVDLVAVADAGYRFTKFTGDLALVDNPATITVRGDTSLTANFAEADSAAFSVNLSDRRQTMVGFGFSHTIAELNTTAVALEDDDEIADYYVNELGGSSIRLPVPPTLLPETPNADNITVDRIETDLYQNTLDYLKTMLSYDPDMKIIYTVWSPPGWMKDSGKVTGNGEGYIGSDPSNRLSDDRYEHMARYFVAWTQFLRSEGLDVHAIGLQNELRFTQGFASCLYTAEEFARLVKTTGEAFADAEVEKPIFFGPEDMSHATVNSRNPGGGARHSPYVDELTAPDVAPYFDVWATHGYSDGVNPAAGGTAIQYYESLKEYLVEEKGITEDPEYWITEGGTGSHEWPAVLMDGIAPSIHEAVVNAHVSLFSPWQYIERAQTTHNTVDYQNGSPYPTKKTYGAMHYYKHIRPGAVNVGVEPAFQGDIGMGAFIHEENNTVVLEILNQSKNGKNLVIDLSGINVEEFTAYRTSRDLNHSNEGTVSVENGELAFALAGESIVTLVGENATFEEQPVASWWPGEGLRRAKEVVEGEPGIGWFDDSSWPFIFTYGIDAGTAGGAWVYIFTEGADRDNFWAYVFSNNDGEEDYYIWGRNAWGFYYQLGENSGWKSFNQ